MPDPWAQDIGHPSPLTSNGNRWAKFADESARTSPTTASQLPAPGRVVNIEDYERTLLPRARRRLRAAGLLLGRGGSTQRGRAEVEPDAVPQALRLLPRAGAPGRRRLRRLALPARRRPGPVQLRLVASTSTRWPTTGPGRRCGLPPARRALRERVTRASPSRRAGLAAILPRAAHRDRPRAPRARDRARDARPRPRAAPTRSSAPWSSRDGAVLGEGWHARVRRRRTPRSTRSRACGGADLPGATLYVSLEPCCHQGKTPPCTDAILAAGIAPRRRRLRRPDREGLRAAAWASCATRA